MASNTNWQEETLGGRIVYAREAMGLTSAQLARRMGVKTETLAGWEADRSRPRSNRLQILSGVLGVSLGWLLTGGGLAPQAEAPEEEGADISAEIDRIRADAARLLERIDSLGAQVQRAASGPTR